MKTQLFAALGFSLLVTTPAFSDPITFGPGNKIGRVANVPALTGQVRRLYGQFRREADYFAAFAVNFETNNAFYIQNFHDLKRAQSAALEGCRQVSQALGCQIYAIAIPKGLPVEQTQASGLSHVALEDFTTRYRDHRMPGTYAAFAISGASHHGFGNAYESEAEARDTAISYCRVGVAQDMAEYGPEARKFARARNWQTCRVVDVQFTPEE